ASGTRTPYSPSIAHRISFPGTALLPYDEIVDQRHRADECSQQPHAVDLDRDTELEQGELQIDRVPAEAIRARADDHRGGGIPAVCKRQDSHLQPFSFSCKTESRFQIATMMCSI